MPSAAFQILYTEHEIILNAIERLQELLAKPDLERVAPELRNLIAFFREYGDGYHHQKEEHVLFPALAQSNNSIDMMVEGLVDHHQLFRESLQRADAAITTGAWSTLDRELRSYANDLKDHIAAENDELFVVAEELLSSTEQDRIAGQFADSDRELGDARKIQLEKIAS